MNATRQTTIAHQLTRAGIDLEAAGVVRTTWSLSCAQDQRCRFSAVNVRTLEQARELAEAHARAWSGHRVKVATVATITEASR